MQLTGTCGEDSTKGSVYWCGWPLPVFTSWLFGRRSERWIPQPDGRCVSQLDDILVSGQGGPCKCKTTHFLGRVIEVNAEDRDRGFTPKALVLGFGGLPVPYGIVEFINRRLGEPSAATLATAPPKLGVAYFAGRGALLRENLVCALGAGGVTVEAGGGCDGGSSCTTKAKRVDRDSSRKFQASRARWWFNVRRYSKYAFVMAAEHGYHPNYVTEKPFLAAVSGAIPIYNGSEVIFDYLNRDRLIVFDGTNDKAVVERVAYLLSNKTAYMEMRALPIFAPPSRLIGGPLSRVRELILLHFAPSGAQDLGGREDSYETPEFGQGTNKVYCGVETRSSCEECGPSPGSCGGQCAWNVSEAECRLNVATEDWVGSNPR